jgi:hypothetical protein
VEARRHSPEAPKDADETPAGNSCCSQPGADAKHAPSCSVVTSACRRRTATADTEVGGRGIRR